MIRLACDSDDLGALIETSVILTYADLITDTDTRQQLRARFPRSRLLFMDRGLGDPLKLATVWDVERGALTPDEVPERFDTAQAAGRQYLTGYVSLDRLPRLVEVMAGRPWWKWVALWGGGLEVPGHPFAMMQFASGKMLGAGVDLSVIRDDTWHPDVLTAPGPAIEMAHSYLRGVASQLDGARADLAETIDGLRGAGA